MISEENSCVSQSKCRDEFKKPANKPLTKKTSNYSPAPCPKKPKTPKEKREEKEKQNPMEL